MNKFFEAIQKELQKDETNTYIKSCVKNTVHPLLKPYLMTVCSFLFLIILLLVIILYKVIRTNK